MGFLWFKNIPTSFDEATHRAQTKNNTFILHQLLQQTKEVIQNLLIYAWKRYYAQPRLEPRIKHSQNRLIHSFSLKIFSPRIYMSLVANIPNFYTLPWPSFSYIFKNFCWNTAVLILVCEFIYRFIFNYWTQHICIFYLLFQTYFNISWHFNIRNTALFYFLVL